MLIKQMLVGVMDVFCYIIGCEITKRAILIDPAGDEEHVVNTAADLGYTIEAVVNTHGHPDHTCGNEQIVKLTRAKIMIHEADWQYLDAYGVSLQWGFRSSPPADVLLRDGDIVEFGNERLTVLHTPGHTPGSICLYGDKNLFTGDTLFVEAVGRTDLPGGDLKVLLRSIKEKILPLPDDTIVWPGHHYGSTPTSTIAWEKRNNPYITDFGLVYP